MLGRSLSDVLLESASIPSEVEIKKRSKALYLICLPLASKGQRFNGPNSLIGYHGKNRPES